MQAANENRRSHPLLARDLDSLSRLLLSVASHGVEETQVSIEASSRLARGTVNVLEKMSAVMAQHNVLSEITSELWRVLCRYAVISELYSDQHRFIVLCPRNGRVRQVTVTLYCLDASSALTSSYRLFRSVVLFSATLRPGAFYRDTLGFADTTQYLQLRSPFPPDRCYRAVVDWIDTRYRHRQSSMAELVELIYQSTGHKPGNYLVFFPSYVYLEQVHTLFCTTHPDRTTWVQSRGQGRQEQQRLLDELDTVGHRVGFAIQGGIFGEGIDYIGERLIGTLVVGTGLPAMNQQTELIAQHYRESGRDGYDFAYRYPGFTRVLQTAGRVIRHESDTGFVLLVDSRFRQSVYRQLFPADWQVDFPDGQITLIDTLKSFWERFVPEPVDSV